MLFRLSALLQNDGGEHLEHLQNMALPICP
jgi:hypothetical protein